jgi:uncharacterized SAM-binding protein YcdF (DUF218 family)
MTWRWAQLAVLGAALLTAAPARAADHAIVVFGAPPQADGTPTRVLESRLQAALDQARRDPAALVVVTGGTVRGSHPEGQVMASWLRKRGVASSRIRIEDRARHTGENADLVLPILERAGVQRVTVVTDRLHLPRAKFHMRAALSAAGLGTKISIRGVGSATTLTGKARQLRANHERNALARDIRLRRDTDAASKPGATPRPAPRSTKRPGNGDRRTTPNRRILRRF